LEIKRKGISAMELKLIEKQEDALRFLLTGVSPAFANALRRLMIAQVPTMAIEDVIVIENTSVMYDEILSHRLGLIPLTTDLDAYVLPEECECKSDLGCSRCRVSFTLEAETKEQTRTVYSEELKSENPSVRPVSEKIPIVKLAPGHKIRLEAYAKLGRGQDHAKWQPVSACAYKFLPKITIDLQKCDACRECVKFCPKKILDIKDSKLTVINETECALCMDCVKHCPKKPAPIKVEWDPMSFVFYVESTGSMPPERIVREAAKLLSAKASLISKQIRSSAAKS